MVRTFELSSLMTNSTSSTMLNQYFLLRRKINKFFYVFHSSHSNIITMDISKNQGQLFLIQHDVTFYYRCISKRGKRVIVIFVSFTDLLSSEMNALERIFTLLDDLCKQYKTAWFA